MSYVKTNDGTKYDVNHCGSMNEVLYITLVGYDMLSVVTAFTNQANTQRIEYYYDEDVFVKAFEGFTVLTDVSQLDKEIRIALINPNFE